MAGAGVRDVVVAADGLLGQHGDRAGSRAAHDAVGTVGLVGHAGVGAWTHHVGARLCGRDEERRAVSLEVCRSAFVRMGQMDPTYFCTLPGT